MQGPLPQGCCCRLPPAHRDALALARRAYLEEGSDDWALRMPRVEALVGCMQRAIA
ncbi:aminoglycoside adenylyltransferase domain-containing protein [Halomonas salipaludis]|uniref:aminoglycoside adenylyltransferase domain-containing protein n=1 Tax=Halomonas salipaludis TaxID=2032625 RepID=UPI001140E5C1|nr:aminoglycoside adenylyltransferase domain-containing protein [Halomonas salipaludis]